MQDDGAHRFMDQEIQEPQGLCSCADKGWHLGRASCQRVRTSVGGEKLGLVARPRREPGRETGFILIGNFPEGGIDVPQDAQNGGN